MYYRANFDDGSERRRNWERRGWRGREGRGGDMGHKLGQRYGNEIEMEWNEMDTPAAH